MPGVQRDRRVSVAIQLVAGKYVAELRVLSQLVLLPSGQAAVGALPQI